MSRERDGEGTGKRRIRGGEKTGKGRIRSGAATGKKWRKTTKRRQRDDKEEKTVLTRKGAEDAREGAIYA